MFLLLWLFYLLLLTSGNSLIGTYTFSDKLMLGPAASGNTNGSFFFPLIWNRLPLTLPISEKKKKILTILSYSSTCNNSTRTYQYFEKWYLLISKQQMIFLWNRCIQIMHNDIVVQFYADVKAKLLLAVSWIIINILMVIGKKEKPITMCYVNLIYWGYIYACHDLLLEYQNIFIVIYLYSRLDSSYCNMSLLDGTLYYHITSSTKVISTNTHMNATLNIF